MWYTGGNDWYHTLQVGYATSPDGLTWSKHVGPVFSSGEVVQWIDNHVNVISIDREYEMYYSSSTNDIRLATSADGVNWSTSDACAIVAQPAVQGWDGLKVTEASVLYANGVRRLWYRGGYGIPTGIGFSL